MALNICVFIGLSPKVRSCAKHIQDGCEVDLHGLYPGSLCESDQGISPRAYPESPIVDDGSVVRTGRNSNQ